MEFVLGGGVRAIMYCVSCMLAFIVGASWVWLSTSMRKRLGAIADRVSTRHGGA
jgi:hypothetical protein